MARYLYALGRWSHQHRVAVLITWLLILAAAVTGASTLSGKTQDSFSIPGVQSVQAFDLMKERSPQAAPDGATASVVMVGKDGATVTSGAGKAKVADVVAQLERLPQVQGVTNPYETGQVSKDGTTALASVSYKVQAVALTTADQTALTDVQRSATAQGLRVEIGGDALTSMPESGSSELYGVLIALVVLAITFGSLLAAGMPLVTALIGVGIGVAGITTATGFVDLGSTTPILATMLGLAVGIDYALFITSRYRAEIRAGRPSPEAAGRAVGTAGSAVVFAGLTVVIALTGLSVVGISFLTQMGLAAAATVLVAVLIALTLLPAVLGFFGERSMRGRIPWLRTRDRQTTTATLSRTGAGRHRTAPQTGGYRWAAFVTRHRWPVFVAGVTLAAIASIPVLSMHESLPDDGSSPKTSTQRQAYDIVADKFGAGANGPLLVLVDTKGVADPQAAVDAVSRRVATVRTDVVATTPAQYSPKTDLATMTVVPRSGPAEQQTQALVKDLRTALEPVPAETGAHVYVTGQTAVTVDVSSSLASAMPTYLTLVVGLAFLLMMLVFRSVLVPLKAVVGFLLSVGTSLGLTVAVFQWGWLAGLFGIDTPGPIMSLLPLLLVGILFGLAMDYEMFLVSRMREAHVHGEGAQRAIITGFQHGARVVTAAALIMIGVFGSFIFNGMAMIRPIGFGLAIGILADAFLVRMTLVPAFLSIVGERAWWLPRWLDRVMPNLDAEGVSLTRYLDEQRAAAEEGPASLERDEKELARV